MKELTKIIEKRQKKIPMEAMGRGNDILGSLVGEGLTDSDPLIDYFKKNDMQTVIAAFDRQLLNADMTLYDWSETHHLTYGYNYINIVDFLLSYASDPIGIYKALEGKIKLLNSSHAAEIIVNAPELVDSILEKNIWATFDLQGIRRRVCSSEIFCTNKLLWYNHEGTWKNRFDDPMSVPRKEDTAQVWYTESIREHEEQDESLFSQQ